ncbi:MAG: hypothetical protein K2L82_03025 [Lachnospiraceae bacterium]|nr:hypothetical protein [Lachnospiraceae bacterium]
MDINEELEEIIRKYQLDHYYPHYRNMYRAEKILQNVIKGIIQRNGKAIFVGNDKTGIAFVRNISKDYAGIRFLYYARNDMGLSRLEKAEWDKDEEIYLISWYGAEYVEKWFRMHYIQYEWIYDIFEREGCLFQREFFAFGKENLLNCVNTTEWTFENRDYVEALQCELYCQQCKYKNASHLETRRIALERCLFITIYMRNFVLAEKYTNLLSEYDKRYESLWEEIEVLLMKIKQHIKHRKQKDIVLYWLDAIPYGDEENMPYLQNMMEKSVVFENAFAYIGYTNSTLRAMFLGKRDIDDEVYGTTMITRDNSPVIRLLEEQGYHIKVFSGGINDKFPIAYSPSKFYMFHFEPVSRKLWDMLAEMSADETKTLWLVHAMEGHMPYLNGRIKDDYFKDGTDRRERYKVARRELDEQLAFYDSYMDEEAIRIYMSDHGQVDPDTYHVLFNIKCKTLKPRKIEGMFTMLDFNTVIEQLLVSEEGEIREEKFTREYVEIGNFDWYSKGNIERLFRNRLGLPMSWIGLKGIIDKEYIYLHYKTGKEWLQKRNDMPITGPLLFYDCESDVCEQALLPKYRQLVREYPENIILDEKFRYSRYIYILYHNMLKHNNMPERVETINRLVESYPDNSIGIRMGGVNSAMLYYILTKENKKKIWGVIDNSKECLCSRLQLHVVSYDHMDELPAAGIKAVLISSYTHLEMLREESKAWPKEIDILDIYDCFDKNGIRCRENFYELKGTDEDYDVGFPFDESK